jgi:hypothetical protein
MHFRCEKCVIAMKSPEHREAASHADGSLLKLVFEDAVVAFDLAADATMADVARRLHELKFRYYAHPRAIVVVRGEARC